MLRKKEKCQVNVSSGNKSTKQKKKKEKKEENCKKNEIKFHHIQPTSTTKWNFLVLFSRIFHTEFRCFESHSTKSNTIFHLASSHSTMSYIPIGKTLRHNANKFKVGEQGTIYDILR